MHPPSAKLMLRVYGYTNTRHLFGQEFLTRFVQKSAPDDLEACDLYDVLAHLGYGLVPKTRQQRAMVFACKHEAWLGSMPSKSAETLRETKTRIFAA